MKWQVQWCRQADVYSKPAASKDEALEILSREFASDDPVGTGITDSRITQEFPIVHDGIFPLSYAPLCRLMQRKELVPFLGAGASLSARPPNRVFSRGCRFAPTAAELAHEIAVSSNLPAWFLEDSQNLSRVASYCQLTFEDFIPADLDDAGLGFDLISTLADIFADCGDPGRLHHFLAHHADKFPVVVTTNYDTLIEQAYITARQPFIKIVHLADDPSYAGATYLQAFELKGGVICGGESKRIPPDTLSHEVGDLPVIYKMHGSVETKQFVITEEDYVRFLSRLNREPQILPPFLSERFMKSRFLFLGYGLEDWNFRVILENLKGITNRQQASHVSKAAASVGAKYGIAAEIPDSGADGRAIPEPGPENNNSRYRHWAIQRRTNGVDQAIWESRKVLVKNMDINDFVQRLEARWALQFPPIAKPQT